MFIELTLDSGFGKRFHVHNIASYVKTVFGTTRVYTVNNVNGDFWTVEQTPEEIDAIINAIGKSFSAGMFVATLSIQEGIIDKTVG